MAFVIAVVSSLSLAWPATFPAGARALAGVSIQSEAIRLQMCETDEVGKRAARRRRRHSNKQISSASATVVAELATSDSLSVKARAAKLQQPQKALELYEQADDPDDVLPFVVRALLRMRSVELALELHDRHVRSSNSPPNTRSTCALFLALCRTRRLDAASRLLDDLESANPPPADPASVQVFSRQANGAKPR